ncbi:TOMM precursor leader peptide-binding protein [Streptomyces sp. NPDC090088]|uniref:TOMM precursor leader peptide-binding protein n=1 Tax=Streptomyces sp. NPDC090088 TaxID=3365944 RepID=UPI0038275181
MNSADRPRVRVGVVGLGAPGTALARLLAADGANGLLLLDPDPLTALDARRLGLRAAYVGRSRQAALTDELTAVHGPVATTLDASRLDASAVDELVRRVDLVVVTTEPGPVLVHDWADRAARGRVPVVHGTVRGHTALIGPTVLPARGPCHRCRRMRALACGELGSAWSPAQPDDHADDFTAARHKPPLTTLAPYVASVLGQEVSALSAHGDLARFVGTVQTYDGRSLAPRWHRLLRHPDCPTCGPWKRRPPPDGPTAPDFDRIEKNLVSPVCGVIRSLETVSQPDGEPSVLHLVWARLANAPLSRPASRFLNSSGRGWSQQEARDGAVAEALEHYCGLMWRPDVLLTASHTDLNHSAVDPSTLALHEPRTENTVLDWTPTRSLLTGEEVWVPVETLSLGQAQSGHTRQQTSNGLAAGAGLQNAVMRALLEVIERDAFFRCWTGRLPTRRHRCTESPDPLVRALAHEYAGRGIELDIHVVPTDTAAHVACAVARAQQPPVRAVGLGAALDLAGAVRRAVMEAAQLRTALAWRLHRSSADLQRAAWLAEDPSRVTTIDDHGLLYAVPQSASAFAFLETVPYLPWPSPSFSPKATDSSPAPDPLRELALSVGRVAPDVLYADVTTPDVTDLEIAVARVIVPGLVPPWFGSPPRSRASSRFPQGALFRSDPHPFM